MQSEEEKQAKRRAYYLANMERIKETSRRNKLNKPDLYKRLNRESIRRMRVEDPKRFKEIQARARAVIRNNPEAKAKQAQRNKEWFAAHPEYMNAWMAKKRRRDPIHYLLHGAKSRAKKAGFPFSITREDVPLPTHCPVLGIEIQYGGGKGFNPSSPSIDKIIPALGYVPGNVRVISYRANELKKDATPEELMKVAVWAAAEVERVQRELGCGPPK